MAKKKKRRKKRAKKRTTKKARRRGRKKRRRSGGHVPIEILNRRLRKLNALVAKRGGGKSL